MKRIGLLAVVLCVAVVMMSAQEKRGTTAQALSLVKKAIEFVKANGKEKAFAAFNDPKGQFVQGDLYILVYDMTGTCLAHGADKARVGKNFIDTKDPDGKEYMKKRVELAKTKGKGWDDYKFKNPVSGKVEMKTCYIEVVDDIIVGCGAYKQ